MRNNHKSKHCKKHKIRVIKVDLDDPKNSELPAEISEIISDIRRKQKRLHKEKVDPVPPPNVFESPQAKMNEMVDQLIRRQGIRPRPGVFRMITRFADQILMSGLFRGALLFEIIVALFSMLGTFTV